MLIKWMNAHIESMRKLFSTIDATLLRANQNEVSGTVYTMDKKKIVIRFYINGKFQECEKIQFDNISGGTNHDKSFKFTPHRKLNPGDKISIRSGFLLAHIENSPRRIPAGNNHIHLLKTFENNVYREPKTFFLHIPKTAGTSLHNTLSKKFPGEEKIPDKYTMISHHGYPHFYYPLELNKKAIDKAKFLYGHYPFVFRHLMGSNARTIVFLRDPVRRVISELYHLKKNERRFHEYPMGKIYKQRLKSNSNLHIRYLWNDSITSRLHPYQEASIENEHLMMAKNNLGRCFLVGITEYFNESLALLGIKWGTDFGQAMRKNVNTKSTQLDPSLVQEISQDNRLDMDLYNYAKDLFMHDCADHGIKIHERNQDSL